MERTLLTTVRGFTAVGTLAFLLAVLAVATVPEFYGLTPGHTGLLLTGAGISLAAHLVLVHIGTQDAECGEMQ